ncbi:CHC2 zinc finger domain-containing protein [uncultured Microbulbifer sp.]|uniref:CHC2 zinc finger domain-containing protein n=1 Tax=uncultured Microbulbifer sp. TaxID=348147 RepID=UPI002617224A|nr:CHC2 zinc finger domain-containing protein [uncultured Microbulbifer sp.]
MARIAGEEIERIKAEVSLERLVEAYGVELARHGKDKVGRCPFHNDKTPSLAISPKTNLYHCFGCGAAGSVIDWVIKTQGKSPGRAICRGLLFNPFNQRNVLLEQVIDQDIELNPLGLGSGREIIQHLGIEVEGQMHLGAGIVELAALTFGKIVLVTHAVHPF